MLKISVGDRVKFKDSYDGCFKEFKGQELTVSEYFKKDAGIDVDCVKLKEIESIEKYHMVRIDWLELKMTELSIKCEKFLKNNKVNSCSIKDSDNDPEFNHRGCDCCKGLATNTYECIGYQPKTKKVIELGDVCGECINYFYNGEG